MQIKKIVNLFLLFLGILIPLFIIYKNIFPDIKVKTDLKNYSHYKKNIILKKNINENEYLIFTCREDYNFGKIILEIIFNEKIPEQVDIPLKKGYESMIFPLGEEITTQEQIEKILFNNNSSNIPNGSLVSNNETVFIISDGKYYPVQSPFDFIKLGFRWENVKPINNDILAKLEKGEKKIYSFEPHLNETILKDENDDLFVVLNQKRIPIKSEKLLTKIWPDYNWVKINKNTIKLTGKCKTKTNQKKVICSYKNRPTNPENIYIFDLKNLKNKSIKEVESVLKANTTNKKNSIKIFLNKIKMRLITRLNRENEIY